MNIQSQKLKKTKFVTYIFVGVFMLLLGCDTITTLQYYYANDWTEHRFDYAEVPFQLDRVLLIPVQVNGRLLDFALDTGSPVIAFIGHDQTSALNFNLGAQVELGGSGTGSSPIGQIVSDIPMSIGNVTLIDQTAVWIPWDEIDYFKSESEVFIDGIIGYDLFKRFVVELDFERNRMTLYPPDSYSYQGNGQIFELTMSGRKPYMTAGITTLDGKTADVKLHVDLGSSTNLTLIPNAKPEIVTPQKTIAIPAWGMKGKSISGLGRIGQLQLGTYELDSVLTRFPYDGYDRTADRHGVLGIGVLSRFKVIFDYPQNRMILEPGTKSFKSFETNKSGIGFSRYNDTYIVNYNLSDSAAVKNKLTVGDVLVSINGIEASALSRQALDSCLSMPGGTTHEFCVMRMQDQICLDVELVDPGI